jgi:hypothetical protein
MYNDQEKEALLAKLELLDHVLRLHEWTEFNGDDAEEADEIEGKIDSDAEKGKPSGW